MGITLLLDTTLGPGLDSPLISQLRESRRSSGSQGEDAALLRSRGGQLRRSQDTVSSKQSTAAQLLGGIVPFSVCLAPQLLTSQQRISISVSERGSTECFLEIPRTFCLLVYLIKAIPQVTGT